MQNGVMGMQERGNDSCSLRPFRPWTSVFCVPRHPAGKRWGELPAGDGRLLPHPEWGQAVTTRVRESVPVTRTQVEAQPLPARPLLLALPWGASNAPRFSHSASGPRVMDGIQFHARDPNPA